MKENVEPLPSELFTEISPLWRLIVSEAMNNPNPKPGNVSRCSPGTLKNRSKILASFDSGIPKPKSSTENITIQFEEYTVYTVLAISQLRWSLS